MMAKNYTDFIRRMASVTADGYTVDRLVLSSESMETFLTDGDFTKQTEELQDDLGEFTVPVESGDGDMVVTESGESFDL